MKSLENYRPAVIEFDVAGDGSLMPETFGMFENETELIEFLNKNLVTVPHGITVSRHMDLFEKTELRKEYNDVLENLLPIHEKELSTATQEFEHAKKNQKEATEVVNADLIKTKALATEVKRGLKEMNLDEQFTYRIAFKGRYYIYTYIDKSFKLCKIKDIPESEKTEIWNNMAKNEEFIETNFNNEPTTKKEGKKK